MVFDQKGDPASEMVVLDLEFKRNGFFINPKIQFQPPVRGAADEFELYIIESHQPSWVAGRRPMAINPCASEKDERLAILWARQCRAIMVEFENVSLKIAGTADEGIFYIVRFIDDTGRAVVNGCPLDWNMPVQSSL